LLPLLLLLQLVREARQERAQDQSAGPAAELDSDSYLAEHFISNIRPWLQRLSVLIIGPGLGSDEWVGDCSAIHRQ
jgi:hypothetical protein